MCVRKFGLMVMLVFCMSCQLWAQDNAQPANNAGPVENRASVIIVTESKIAQPQANATQKVDVVYQDDLARQTNPNRNLSELLKNTSGQFVNPLSRNDANWGSFGGLGPKYNVYLLDGLPIDAFADAMALDPWAFERVELYKGPAAVMYSNYLTMDFAGNEAPLAGITNFIIKDKIDAPATRVRIGQGSYKTTNAGFYHQDRKGNLNFLFGGGYERSDYTDYGTEDSWLHFIDDPAYQKTKLYLKGTYYFDRDDHKLSLFAHHTQHTGDAGRPNRDFDHNYDTVNLVYGNQINPHVNIQVKTGYRGYDRRWAEDNYPDLSLKEHDGVVQKIYPSDLTINLKHAENSVLTCGVDTQYATYKTYAEVDGTRTTGNDVTARMAGLYLQEKYILDQWVLRAGARRQYTKHDYDLISGATPGRDAQSWNKTILSGGVRFNAARWIALYGNAGNSYIVPSAKAVGGTLNAADFGVAGKNGQLPNPDLKPEKGLGSDVGLDLMPLDTLKIGVRGFFNQVDDVLVDNRVSDDPSQTKSINAGKARSQGVEVAVEHAPLDKLQWFANFTYTDTEVKNNLDPDQDGADISFVPNSIANVGFTAKLPFDITVSPYLNRVGRYYDSTSLSGRQKFGPYETVNIKIEKLLVKTADYALNASLDLNNVGDRKYIMPWQFQDPGFNMYAAIDLRF